MEESSNHVGVLVVHGLGAQDAGETVGKLLGGLKRVEPNLVVEDAAAGKPVTVGGQNLRFYEVYWADLLRGDKTFGSFQMTELQGLSWFPWFNFLRGSYTTGDYSVFRVLWWSVLLPLVSFLIFLGYHGASFIAQVVGGRNRKRNNGEIANASSVGAVLRKIVGRTNRYTLVDKTLDEFAGDVFNYVNSAADAFHRQGKEPPVPEHMLGVHAQIIQRFYDQLLQAHSDGCESIQVVSHSLGTVVTYHALTGFGFDENRADRNVVRVAAAKVQHLYTIGCPLEKIRFFWPRLISGQSMVGETRISWDNFVSWFDPVAGVVRRFREWGHVDNHRLLGGGFVRGHVVYERSPVFLRVFTRGLCGRALLVQRTVGERLKNFLVLVGETLLAPVGIILVLALGVVVLGITITMTPFLLSFLFRPFVSAETLGPLQDKASLVIAIMMVSVLLFSPSVRASRVHRRHWVKTKFVPRSEPRE